MLKKYLVEWKNEFGKTTALICGILIILLGLLFIKKCSNTVYTYVDLQGNKGVASECLIDNGKLICYEYYSNGVIEVQQFVKIK